jgi:hypothetical protein
MSPLRIESAVNRISGLTRRSIFGAALLWRRFALAPLCFGGALLWRRFALAALCGAVLASSW